MHPNPAHATLVGAILRSLAGHAPGVVAIFSVALGGCAPELDWSESIALWSEDAPTTALVEAADARWEAAGVHPNAIRIMAEEEGAGVPVGWLPSSNNMAHKCRLPDALNVCGCVALHERSGPTHVWLNRMCANRDVVAHELGHLIARRPRHLSKADGCGTLEDPMATAPHLMCERVGTAITAADLELVCEEGTCVGFSPEAALD